MIFIDVLKNGAALATVITGLFSLLNPLAVQSFTGLQLPGPRGITEVRAVLGGFFIALGTVPMIFQNHAMFLMLGVAYLTVAVVRAVSMLIDKSFVKSNYASLAVEILLGLLLII